MKLYYFSSSKAIIAIMILPLCHKNIFSYVATLFLIISRLTLKNYLDDSEINNYVTKIQ